MCVRPVPGLILNDIEQWVQICIFPCTWNRIFDQILRWHHYRIGYLGRLTTAEKWESLSRWTNSCVTKKVKQDRIFNNGVDSSFRNLATQYDFILFFYAISFVLELYSTILSTHLSNRSARPVSYFLTTICGSFYVCSHYASTQKIK